ncbi:MAG TPA: hypothetical protein PL193_16460 [Xanthobacteraceae bacterium]|nr:hypothetical protein [Xanthobacteraceae bacterium]
MIRFLFRFTGLWLIAGAFAALVIDGTRSVSASRFIFAPVRDIWTMFDAATLKMVQEKAAPGLAAELLERFLAMPFFVLLALLGLLFLLIGRRKRERLIGYSSRD